MLHLFTRDPDRGPRADPQRGDLRGFVRSALQEGRYRPYASVDTNQLHHLPALLKNREHIAWQAAPARAEPRLKLRTNDLVLAADGSLHLVTRERPVVVTGEALRLLYPELQIPLDRPSFPIRLGYTSLRPLLTPIVADVFGVSPQSAAEALGGQRNLRADLPRLTKLWRSLVGLLACQRSCAQLVQEETSPRLAVILSSIRLAA